MVPNKLVHSAELPLEHERAYARLFGKLEYLAKRRREEYNMTTTNALLSSQSSNYQRSFILGNTNKNIISLRIHACNPILYPGIHLCIYKKK